MPFRDQIQLSRVFLGALVFVLLATIGCVGSAWKQTLEEDTPAAYYRFMRDHADSEFAPKAREHLDTAHVQAVFAAGRMIESRTD